MWVEALPKTHGGSSFGAEVVEEANSVSPWSEGRWLLAKQCLAGKQEAWVGVLCLAL